MPNVLPSVRAGRTQVLYPFVRRVKFSTALSISANGSEQRSAQRGVPLFEGTLNYKLIPRSERDALNTFFANMAGQDLFWQMTVLGVLYANLKFTQDVLSWKEGPMNLYAASVNWRQVYNTGYTIPTPGASFPLLSSGAFAQLPWSSDWRQLTTVNDQASGWAYAFRWYGASLNGFPSASLRRWSAGGPQVPDADVATLEADFVGRLGMYKAMSVTDPEDSSVHPNCRYASDVMEIQYLGFKQTAVNLVLEETNG
jgi:hypothetical protein